MIKDEDSFPSCVELKDDCFNFGTKHRSETTAVGKLRVDLRRVFVVLNDCWSLCLLEEITETFGKEIEEIVIELGNLALPFCIDKSDEHYFTIIKKCLEKFVQEPEIPEPIDTKEVTDKIPYVKFLQYEPDGKPGKMFTFKTDEPFFNELNFALVEGTSAHDYALKFARKMKEKKNGWIRVDLTDKEMVVKLIHDVRYLTCKAKNPPLDTEDKDLLEALRAVREEVQQPVSVQDMVKLRITRFQQDLTLFQENGCFEYLKSTLDGLHRDLETWKI